VLSTAVYQDLGRLTRLLFLIFARIDGGAQPPEIDLLVDTARETLSRLAGTIGATDADPVSKLHRHLHWLGYWFARDEPDSYQPDVEDITQRDLPGVIDLVNKWERDLLSPGLVDAVMGSWEVKNYLHVVRDAFVYLEDALRRAGGISPAEGMTAEALVNRLLAPGATEQIDLSQVTPQGPRTKGEQQGLLHLFKGAFLLFRNPAAHRVVEYTPEQADELLRLVNLCLRMLGEIEAPPLIIRLPDGVQTNEIVRRIEQIADAHPGWSAIHVYAGASETPLALARRLRVAVTSALIAGLRAAAPQAQFEWEDRANREEETAP